MREVAVGIELLRNLVAPGGQCGGSNALDLERAQGAGGLVEADEVHGTQRGIRLQEVRMDPR